MNTSKITRAAIAGFGTSLLLATSMSAQAGGRLTAPVPDWTCGAVVCELMSQIL